MEKSWEESLKDAIAKNKIEVVVNEKKQPYDYFLNSLRKLFTINLAIGLLAALLMLIVYGANELVRTLLAWIIGITLIATFGAVINKYSKKE